VSPVIGATTPATSREYGVDRKIRVGIILLFMDSSHFAELNMKTQGDENLRPGTWTREWKLCDAKKPSSTPL
jgi:hypothetical protein